MKKTRLMTLGFVATLIGATFALSTNLNAQTGVSEESRLSALAKFTKVLGTVEQYYVDDITFNEIITKSIEGLLSNLDAHSGFLDQKKFKDMKVQTDGEFGGLGITVGMRDGALTVIAPIEDTPADKAGLKSGDIVLRIDEQSTLNMTIDEAVGLMRGKPQTDIVLTIVREGEAKPLTFKITRDIIKINSVYTKTFENENLLYLRITSFDKNVVEKTKEALSKHRSVNGIIMDLRNNPGGLLDQAVNLTDLFVSEGIIVSQKGRVKGEDQDYTASKRTTITNVPMVVLLNGGSASASEIVGGALQDHKRAIVVGEKTFGKGSVQVILPVGNEEALRLTIARYYLPSGRTIQAVGVTPDIIVHPGNVPAPETDYSIKENDLKLHLTSELEKLAAEQKMAPKKKTDESVISAKQLYGDIQLKSAVDIVKVLSITKPKH
ncbi:S41 family peptidase [Sulfurospirillum sp. T05]|uniref:S41 family peptidase n=1 Tax=Sulfurospirillum tamanense TaxID=2813362 RepID=A0ABS2WRT0_9BACT|nr:S41 family peptidase [Sulfurospirillum tamanensis]MBN2964310.1 S41 family peptidase [Sulfurospirillum tamanensis]